MAVDGEVRTGLAADVDERQGDGGRAAAAVFTLYVAIALPVIVFVLADHRWFFRDDWAFLSGRDVSVDGLFTPHFGQHLSAVPVLVFRWMWTLFGANSYVPYQLLIAVTHLGVVVLLRALLRHLGVGPWLATAAASILVLWGPAGGDNLTWAFQINFTGSIVFGLAQLLLADHDGPMGRRDLLALLLGLLGVLSSAIGVTMIVVVGAALLLRQGWRSAALQTAPLTAVVLAWAATMHPASESPAGPPPDRATTVRWVRWSFTGAFEGLGHYAIVGLVMAVLIVGGLALNVSAARAGHPTSRWARVRQRIRPVAVPLAMLAGALLFTVLTAHGRWFSGEFGARAGRYVYVLAVLIIPALAMAAEAVAHRWPRARPALVLLLLLPVPFNLDGFDEPLFNARYFAHQEALITGSVDMPLARQVPRDNHPPGFDPTMGEDMTIGFLLDAHEQGRLPGAGRPLPPRLEDELTIGLAIKQGTDPGLFPDCRRIDSPLELHPEKGDTYRIGSAVLVTLARSATDPPARVLFHPDWGPEITFEVGGIPFVLSPPIQSEAFLLCEADP